ncbi:MAG: hypothetical protein KQH59_06480 [Desulfobulbaceae bacterium]|nr:hypothetical protein [Desulfobulbaceae bacterium]
MKNAPRPSLDEISAWLAEHPSMIDDSFPWLGIACLVCLLVLLFLVGYRLLQNVVRTEKSKNQGSSKKVTDFDL